MPAPLETDNRSPSPQALAARYGGAMTVVAALTLLVELGVYWLGLYSGAGPRDSFLAALGAMTVWVALASPALASGAAAHGPAGASIVSLIVLSFVSKYLTSEAAAQIACILAGMSLAASSAVRCAKSPTGRLAAGAMWALVMMLALATPFWTGSLLQTYGRFCPALVAGAVYANPYLCVTAAVVNQTRFVWHSSGFMYDWSTLRDAAPPAILWYPSSLMCLAAAAVFELIVALRRKRAGPKG